ncbi:unnamed protein product [Danaus chrysippus]|uniref:Proteasome assembly chaperone 2 n=1 Tax=Danaus chrysippus TaxID=151541 RepID=A0A8J2VT97_9NEOP|nr:unnamed protein product [Danaus chrysippus]
MEANNLWKLFIDEPLEDYTLVIPSVAVGNVGQLACDLLISSLKMVKIASVHSLAQIPVVGYDPYDLKSNNLSSACEVYKSESKKLVVVQIRSPLIYKYARSFLTNIVDTFKSKGIKDVIILTSSFAHEKKLVLSSSFRYVATENSPYRDKITELKLTEHESVNDEIKIFGGGFACLLHKICQEKSLPCLILYKYCSEGDNLPDAYEMIGYLTKVHDIFPKDKDLFAQLKEPVSWKLLFGRPPPADIY